MPATHLMVDSKALLEGREWKRVTLAVRSTSVDRAISSIACRFDQAIDEIDPSELAYVNPQSVGGVLSYGFETSHDQNRVGCGVCAKGGRNDPVEFYVLVCMVDRSALEMVRYSATANVTSLYLDGEMIASITALEYAHGLPVAWEIRSATRFIGNMRRPSVISNEALLQIQRDTKPPIPVVLARQPAGVTDLLKILGKMLTWPIWLLRAAPPNDDYVIPRNALLAAPDISTWVHMGISVFFRMELGLGFSLAFPP